MPKESNPVLSIRIPQKMIDEIDRHVESGDYRTRAEYVMASLRDFRDVNPSLPPNNQTERVSEKI